MLFLMLRKGAVYMKKILLIISLIFVLFLVGCNSNENQLGNQTGTSNIPSGENGNQSGEMNDNKKVMKI